MLYRDGVACSRIDCGRVMDPREIGLPPVGVLRKRFPELCSESPADKVRTP